MAKVTLPPDPWQNVLSLHDLRADELISGLQKCLRRGLTERALLIAYEMFVTSAEFEEHLWTRLSVISVEDVGKGNTMMPILVDTLYRMHLRIARPLGDRYLFAAHAIRLIAESAKDRTTDDMINFAKLENQVRDKAPEIPDFALDMHTKRGSEMGRNYEHFMKEASRIENPAKDRDSSYRDRIMAAIDLASSRKSACLIETAIVSCRRRTNVASRGPCWASGATWALLQVLRRWRRHLRPHRVAFRSLAYPSECATNRSHSFSEARRPSLRRGSPFLDRGNCDW